VSPTPLTRAGAERLRAELAELKGVRRAEVVRAIAEARAHGDLRENAEYHAAKEQQAFIEGRIHELESQLAGAQVVDPSRLNADGRVVFGATVHLRNLATGEEVCYQVVGELEADIRAGRISVVSPIARALIGREEGDVVTVRAPGGDVDYEILAVEYR